MLSNKYGQEKSEAQLLEVEGPDWTAEYIESTCMQT